MAAGSRWLLVTIVGVVLLVGGVDGVTPCCSVVSLLTRYLAALRQSGLAGQPSDGADPDTIDCWLQPIRDKRCGLGCHPGLNVRSVRQYVAAAGAQWIVGSAQVNGL